jgi:hypothetical protein
LRWQWSRRPRWCTLKDLPRRVAEDLQRLQGNVHGALNKTAEDAVTPIRKRTPKAFGDLAESAHAVTGETPKTVVDAPHPGAVEIGSRPHKPDFEKLLAWVKLRGIQARIKDGRRRGRFARSSGPTTAEQSRRVGAMFAALVENGASPVDAPEQIARAISAVIEEEGTPPHCYVKNALPEIAAILDRNVRKAIRRR